jgi:GntR family transcriptional regulator/MocR family aminotransferase
MSVWVKFLKHSLPVVAEKAFAKGLIMSDGLDYDTEKMKYNSVGMGFAALNNKEQDRVVEILKEAMG